MRIIQPQAARGQPFDNSTNGFTATDTQSAIEEAKETAQGLPRWIIVLTHNGTVGNGNYIGLTELLADKRILFPTSSQVKEFSWNNNNTNVGVRLRFYKNSLTNLVYTYNATAGDNANGYGYHQLTTPISLDPGDFIYIKYTKTGGFNVSDLGFMLWGLTT